MVFMRSSQIQICTSDPAIGTRAGSRSNRSWTSCCAEPSRPGTSDPYSMRPWVVLRRWLRAGEACPRMFDRRALALSFPCGDRAFSCEDIGSGCDPGRSRRTDRGAWCTRLPVRRPGPTRPSPPSRAASPGAAGGLTTAPPRIPRASVNASGPTRTTRPEDTTGDEDTTEDEDTTGDEDIRGMKPVSTIPPLPWPTAPAGHLRISPCDDLQDAFGGVLLRPSIAAAMPAGIAASAVSRSRRRRLGRLGRRGGRVGGRPRRTACF